MMVHDGGEKAGRLMVKARVMVMHCGQGFRWCMTRERQELYLFAL